MLEKWTLGNFKSYEGLNEFNLAPLTILCGANSSGKSSLIQSILAIKQTIQYSPIEHALALNGPLVQLGLYTDIHSARHSRPSKDAPPLSIGWQLAIPSQKSARTASYRKKWEKFSASLEFDSDFETDAISSNLIPRLLSSKVEAITTETSGETDTSKIEIERPKRSRTLNKLARQQDLTSQAFVVRSLDETSKSQVDKKIYTSSKLVSAGLWHFIPDHLYIEYNDKYAQAEKTLDALSYAYNIDITEGALPPLLMRLFLRESKDTSLSSKSFRDLLPRKGGITYKNLANLLRQDHRAHSAFRRIMRENVETIRKILRQSRQDNLVAERIPFEMGRFMAMAHSNYFRFQLKYLGPLRDEPKAAYPLQSSVLPTDVGIKGERTAAVLNLHEKMKVEYISPEEMDSLSTANIKRAELSTAVNEWLRYLNIAQAVKTEDKGKFGHILQVRMGSSYKYHDLTNVGVGVSQVLPIIVMCLLSKKGDTLIFEQPELHLNPSVQTKLADFFLSIITQERQCIIETHSEYLIERLRYRVAQNEERSILDKMKVLFLSNTSGKTEITDININQYGAILDWPEDFFDQSAKEAQNIVGAALRKRKQEENKGN